MTALPAHWREDVPLAPKTTLGVGGRARFLVPWKETPDLVRALELAHTGGWPHWLLGGGSNVIVADAGLPGVVLQPHAGAIRVMAMDPDAWTLCVEAGVVWDDLVAWTVAQGLGGLECLSGIPGLVGSAPIQNIGAYGQEVAQVVSAVEDVEVATGHVRAHDVTACGFGYRQSRWKQRPDAAVVTRVYFRLPTNAAPCVAYAQVADALASESLPTGRSGLERVRETVLRLRRAKGMVVDRADPDSRSCGSFFVNPVLSTATPGGAEWCARVAAKEAPGWPQGTDHVKLSAAWLIEHSGMTCGFGTGSVGLSTKHTLALVNRGGATAADVLAFAAEVADRVAQRWHVALEREPVLLA